MLVKQPGITLFLVMFSLLFSIINLPFTSYMYANPESAIKTLLLMLIISLPVISLILSIFGRIILNMFDNREIGISNLTSIKIITNLLIYLVMYIVIIIIGHILLIIPGIIFSVKLLPGFCLIIDEDSNAIEALKKSWNITLGFTWKIFLFLLVYDLFVGSMQYLLGIHSLAFIFILTIVALIFAYAQVFLYRTVLSQWQSNVGLIEDMRFNALNYSFPMLNNVTIAVMVIIIIISLIIYAKIEKPSLKDMYQPDFQYSSINHNGYNSKHSTILTMD